MGFIVGGAIVAARGLGKNPIRTMLLLVAAIGIAGALSTIRELGWVYIVGVWVFMAMIPAVEAAEQTVIQRVVPYEKQGRVFGFANTFEAAAAPVRAALAGLDRSRHTVIHLPDPTTGVRGIHHRIVSSLGGQPLVHHATLAPQAADALAAEHAERGRTAVSAVPAES